MACAVCTALTCGAALDPKTVATNTPVPPGDSERVSNAFEKLSEAGRPARGPGMNILLVGLDRREGLSQKTKNRLHVNGKQCDCTDVMMLLHISADRRRVSVVSIPRDSYVRFAAHRDHGKGFGKITERTTRHLGKINSAYAHGGPALTIRTVEQSTGVRIDHYAETDFPGFEKTVNRLKGTQVCSAEPLKDKNSGLKLAAGTHTLNGNHALRFVRARHVDPPGDLGRIRRQQHVLGDLLRTLTSDRTAGSPLEVVRAAAALSGSVRWDKGFTTRDMARLARDLRGLTAKRTEFATVPIQDFDHRAPVWGSTLRWDGPRARALFADLRADRPITGNTVTGPAPGATPVPYRPEDVSVRVEGSGKTAEHVAQELRDNGFQVTGPRRATADGSGRGRTEITYDDYWQRKASTVSAAMPGAVMRPQKVKGSKHSQVFTVRPGTEGADVTDVVYDRSSVVGAPVRGDELGCDGRTPHSRD
ncbi:LCP family protein [Streptomyces sp. WMMB 322]|uniref:LCP family protein n=1 Tax=Streptomyces sp. WMMB 322 TaxID=1286821 RepID=UPI0006E452E3|nr:LCP family protein [Streptomyces sp. WMMB 322]